MSKLKNFDKDDDEDQYLIGRGITAFRLIILASSIAIYVYYHHFGNKGWSTDQAIWGQFGDYLGGLMNPFVGLVTVYLVLVNVRLQKKELKASLEEMRNSNRALTHQNSSIRKQNFEQSFFTWLSSYQHLVASVQYDRLLDDKSAHGRSALYSSFQDRLGTRAVSRIVSNGILTPGAEYLDFIERGLFPGDRANMIQAAILAQWEELYDSLEHHIDSMFRTLYRLISWIDDQPREFLSNDEKWHYMRIIRAQLSQVEMQLLFLNCFTQRGAKLSAYVNRYALFDNLNLGREVSIRFLAASECCPFTDNAYQSDIARSGRSNCK